MAARIAGGGRVFLIYLFSLKPGENNSHVEDASFVSGEKHLLTGRHSQENSLQTELVKELLPLSPPNNCSSTTLFFSLSNAKACGFYHFFGSFPYGGSHETCIKFILNIKFMSEYQLNSGPIPNSKGKEMKFCLSYTAWKHLTHFLYLLDPVSAALILPFGRWASSRGWIWCIGYGKYKARTVVENYFIARDYHREEQLQIL